MNEYIISHCAIRDNAVYKDGQRLYAWRASANPGLSEFLHAVYKYFQIDYPKFYKMDSLSKLGWLASEILLKEDKEVKKHRPEEIAIVLSNANASLDTDIRYLETAKDIPSPAVFVYTLPNIMIGEISIRNNYKGENGFFIFDRFDAGFLEQYVGQLLEEGQSKICICGWVDVWKEDYHAVLFLVAKKPSGSLFTKENLDKIFMGGSI